jgi:hypothetical protein
MRRITGIFADDGPRRHGDTETNLLSFLRDSLSPWPVRVAVAALVFVFLAPVGAQEGHPLVGTWRGTWGPSAKERHDLTFVMEYDGKNVTGIINPGFDSMKLMRVVLDPGAWTVRFETETQDKSGKAIPVVIDAKFEDITNRHRSLVGTWTQGPTRGDFKITLE